MAAGAGKPNRILAVFQLIERFGRAVFVHRLDLPVAGDAAFQLYSAWFSSLNDRSPDRESGTIIS
jgi:hypothetical protein